MNTCHKRFGIDQSFKSYELILYGTAILNAYPFKDLEYCIV